MANVSAGQPQKRGFFSNLANPVLRIMEKNGTRSSENTATYSGIIGKTVFFLVMTMVGASIAFIVHDLILGSGAPLTQIADKKGVFELTVGTADGVVMVVVLAISLVTPFLAWFLRKTIPVTGTIYCLAQGVLIGYITIALAPNLKFISVLAMLLTLGLVAGMLFVYAKRIITVTARFRGVITAIFFGIVLAGIIFFILNLIPGIRNSSLFQGINSTLSQPAVSIVVSIVFVIIASFFMLADFDTIERCVENGMEKQYEWMAAWGLAYTILYIYFKILRILIMIFGGARGSSK